MYSRLLSLEKAKLHNIFSSASIAPLMVRFIGRAPCDLTPRVNFSKSPERVPIINSGRDGQGAEVQDVISVPAAVD